MDYELQEYVSANGRSYFHDWFMKIGANAAAKVTAALYKLEKGNFSNTKFIGNGIWEFKINAGPGYRIYFAKVDKEILLLLAGGSKQGQSKDIKLAKKLLEEHKALCYH